MRFRLRRRRLPPTALHEATQARAKAERDLEAIRAETPRYQALGDSLRQIRQENGFLTAFRHSVRGGHT